MEKQALNATRSLVWRCIFSVMLLALLVLANFLASRQQLQQMATLENSITQFEQMNRSVHEATLLVRQLMNTGLTTNDRQRMAKALQHHGDTLTNLKSTVGHSWPEVFRQPGQDLPAMTLAFADSCRQLAVYAFAKAPSSDHVAVRTVNHLMYEQHLPSLMQDCHAELKTRSNAHASRLMLLNRWHLFSILAVLVFVSIFVLAPMIRRIQIVMTNLASLNETLESRVQERTNDLEARASELMASNETLRELREAMESAVEGIARVDRSAIITGANSAFANLLNQSVKNIRQAPMLELFPDAESAKLAAGLELAKSRGTSEVELKAKSDDKTGTMYLQLVLVKASSGEHEFDGFHCFAKNISARKVAEVALRESEGRFRQLTDHLQQVLWLYEPASDRIIHVNPAFQSVFGVSRSDVFKSNDAWMSAIHEEDRAIFAEARKNLATEGLYDLEYRIVRPDGSIRWIRDRAFPIMIEGNTVSRIAGIADDITESKLLHERLRVSRQSFENLIMNCDVAMLVTDSEGLVQFVNPAALSLLRRKREEILGKVFSLATADKERTEIPLLEENRQVGIAEVSLIRTEWDGQVALFLIMRDITERKRAEEELHSYAAELMRSNKELEDFAFVASHDLQEPLRKIKSFGDRLIKKYFNTLGEDGRTYLERMQNAAQRMDRLIHDLLTYSRVTTKAQPFEMVDLGEIVHEVLGDLEVRIEQTRGKVEVGQLPTIQADPMQMRQLFQNLIGNALKFSKDDEPPHVRVFKAPVLTDIINPHATQFESEMVRVVVSDNGIGFDQKYQDRIFEVFQRLHGRDKYEGTGTGLAVCRKIVHRHHGILTAESTPGEGATFIITLPFSQEESVGDQLVSRTNHADPR